MASSTSTMKASLRSSHVLLMGGVALIVAGFTAFLVGESGTAGDPAGIEASLTTTTSPLPTTAPAEIPSSSPRRPLWAPNTPAPLVEGPVPVRLTVPAIGVDAPVLPFGVDRRSGQMDVPDNTRDVAWYRYGPRPGEPGSAVLAAHVDLAGQGRGVFFSLESLEPGEVVVVMFDDGSVTRFRVEARVTYAKEELPLEVIFSREGPPVLTLVTCGGRFDRSASRYDSNVVVYAVPVDAPQPTLPPA